MSSSSRVTGRRLAVLLGAAALLAGACSDDADTPAALPESTTTLTGTIAPSPTAPTTAPTTVPTTSDASTGAPTSEGPDNGNCAGSAGSSPTIYDPTAGTYAVNIATVTADAIEFDVVQWLSGPDAADAYHADFPDDPDGPPNDYYIVNENPATYAAVLSPDAEVRLVRLSEDSSADLDPGTVEELPDYFASNGDEFAVYWLTVNDGVVESVCEQYRP